MIKTAITELIVTRSNLQIAVREFRDLKEKRFSKQHKEAVKDRIEALEQDLQEIKNIVGIENDEER